MFDSGERVYSENCCYFYKDASPVCRVSASGSLSEPATRAVVYSRLCLGTHGAMSPSEFGEGLAIVLRSVDYGSNRCNYVLGFFRHKHCAREAHRDDRFIIRRYRGGKLYSSVWAHGFSSFRRRCRCLFVFDLLPVWGIAWSRWRIWATLPDKLGWICIW